MGPIPRGTTCLLMLTFLSKSLWVKVSAKCINVNMVLSGEPQCLKDLLCISKSDETLLKSVIFFFYISEARNARCFLVIQDILQKYNTLWNSLFTLAHFTLFHKTHFPLVKFTWSSLKHMLGINMVFWARGVSVKRKLFSKVYVNNMFNDCVFKQW